MTQFDQEGALASQMFDMLEKETRGVLANSEYTKAHEDEFRNIPVETLVTDKYFLNLKDSIYPSHLDDIIELFEERKSRPINLALFEESVGSGKSFLASTLIWLQWYEVATIHNPQAHFKLADGSTICFMTMSRTELQARRVIFSDVFKRFSSGFNKDYFPPNPRFQKEIQIPQNNTVVYAGTSSELCLSHDTLVYTGYDELTRLGTLIGDKDIDILGFDTEEQMVVATTASTVVDSGEKDLFEVEFDDGTIVQCTNEHKFLTGDGTYKTLKDITDEEIVCMESSNFII